MEECSLWDHRYHGGVCRITNNFFFFVEAKGERKFCIPWTSIDDMQRRQSETFDSLLFLSQTCAEVSHYFTKTL